MQRKCNEKNDWPNGFYRLRWSSSMPMYGSRFAEVPLRHQKIPMLASADLAAMTKKTHWPKLGREGCANEDISRASCHQCLWTLMPKSFIKWRQCFTPLVSCLSTPLCDCLRKQVTKICIITSLLSNRQLAPTVHKVAQRGCVCVYIYIHTHIYIYTGIYNISWKVLGCPDGCLLFKSQSTSKLVSPTPSMAHWHWRLRPSGTSPGAHGVLRVG